MTKAPWFNSGLHRLTVSLGRERQGGDKLGLSIFWLYGLLWVPPLLSLALAERYLSPTALYYGSWLFTYVPALPGFYVLQQEYRPAISQFGMTRIQLRSRRVCIWASVAILLTVSWFGFLYWIARVPGGTTGSDSLMSPGQGAWQGLLSCSHPVFATLFGIVIGPTIEEFVFRGYLYLVLRQNKGRRFAALVSSAVFGIFHGPNAPAVFAQSLFYIYFDNQAESLLPSIIGHAAWNGALLLTCLFGGWRRF